MGPIDLDCQWPQADFGQLIGVSQQAVSDLLSRDVIRKGDTARAWLSSYCDHMREVAAGRDPDGLLSTERARVAKETADKIAMANAVTRREFAPVGLLEIILGDIARQIAARLDALLPQIVRRHADLPSSIATVIAEEVATCRLLCAQANLASAERIDREASGDDEADAE